MTSKKIQFYITIFLLIFFSIGLTQNQNENRKEFNDNSDKSVNYEKIKERQLSENENREKRQMFYERLNEHKHFFNFEEFTSTFSKNKDGDDDWLNSIEGY